MNPIKIKEVIYGPNPVHNDEYIQAWWELGQLIAAKFPGSRFAGCDPEIRLQFPIKRHIGSHDVTEWDTGCRLSLPACFSLLGI